jgi:hypothetical protein
MPSNIRFAPFDWSQLYDETEFSVYNGDTTVVYKPTPFNDVVEHYERLLELFADDNTDEYEHLPMWEAVRITDATRGWYWNEKERSLMKKNKWNSKHIPKSRENK